MKNIFVLVLLIFTSLQAEQHYQIFDISPKDSFSSQATDMNEQGEIVGVYSHKNKSPAITFLWDKEKGFQDLVDLNIDSKSADFIPPKINNLGHVVGAEKIRGTWRTLWASYRQTFIWTLEKGKILLASPEGYIDVVPVSFNDHDQILMLPPKTNLCGCKPYRLWVWQEGTFDEIRKKIFPQQLSNDQIIIGNTNGSWDDKTKALTKLPVFYNTQDKTENPLASHEEMKYGNVLMINNKGDYVVVYREKEALIATEKYYFYTPDNGLQELPAGFLPLSLNNHGEIIGVTKSEKMIVDMYVRAALKKVEISPIEKNERFQLYENGDLQQVSFSSDDPNFVELINVIKINEGRQLIGTAHYSVRGRLQQRAVFLVPTEDNRLIYRLRRNYSNSSESPHQ